MADILSQPAPKTTAEYKAAIRQMMDEMERLNQKMREDQTDIDRTQAEAAILKAETRALLARMGAPV
jgi:ABC-type Zn uptake system ZnuABC Zn-binding protein ZnuA